MTDPLLAKFSQASLPPSRPHSVFLHSLTLPPKLAFVFFEARSHRVALASLCVDQVGLRLRDPPAPAY